MSLINKPKSIAEIMAEKLEKQDTTKKRGGINSPRANAVFQLIVFMGEDKTLDEERFMEKTEENKGKEAKRKRVNKRMKYWLGRTKLFQPTEIFQMMSQAKEGKPKEKLFNYILKTNIIKKKNEKK
jgi:hypothetical protein